MLWAFIREFANAFRLSKQVVAKKEEVSRQGKPIPPKEQNPVKTKAERVLVS